MIEIRIFSNLGHIKGYEVSGHSGYARSGKDIVCAAVSAIALTALDGLITVLNIKPEEKMEDGYLKVILPENMNEDCFYETDIVLKTMNEGFKSLAHQYSKFISYSVQEV